jgi:hypothetical protein
MLSIKRRWGMNVEGQDSGGKRLSIGSVVLGVVTVVLLVFFTIPSIPNWWAVFHLPGIEGRIQETTKQLATEQDALEKLEVKKLMSSSDPSAQEKLEGKIVDLKKEADLIRAELNRQKQLQEIGKAQLAVGTGHTNQETFWLWLKHLLEIGGFVAGIGHVMDGMKRLMSWLGLLRVSA